MSRSVSSLLAGTRSGLPDRTEQVQGNRAKGTSREASMRALASFYASQRSKGRCTVANTLVLLPRGTIYLGTAKHSSVVKVLNKLLVG
jgi:hypothetical protein